MNELLSLMPEYLGGHIRLTMAALFVSVSVSVPLGIFAASRPRIGRWVVGTAGVIQTIPALALLAIMVPLLAALSLPGIGFLPAFLGLTLYGILPVLNNTVTGLRGVDPGVREAALGVGMTPGQRLWLVELPLALPIIVAGIRTGTVWLVGMATLSTPVGATSLGNYIFSGLQTRNFAAVLLGCLASAVLALALDGMVRVIERLAAGGQLRRAARLGGLTVTILVGSSAASLATEKALVVGGKTFTEQYVLAEILTQTIHRETARPARQLTSLGSTVAFDALRNGEIDFYVDYSGTIWSTILGERGPSPGREEVLSAVRRRLPIEHGVHVVSALGFQNIYTLAMAAERARELGVSRISDLARLSPTLTLGADYEFLARPEWKALRRVYGLEFASARSMDASLMYEAVATGQVDVISAFSTDGRIGTRGLVLLEDDRNVIPPYDAIVLASESALATHADAVAAIRTLSGTIDDAQMRGLNGRVDADGASPAAVAREFLNAHATPG